MAETVGNAILRGTLAENSLAGIRKDSEKKSIKYIRLLSVGELRFGNELVGIFCQFRSAPFRFNFGS